MPPIVTTAEIDRPADRVFATATDPALFPQWQKGVEDGHMEGPADRTSMAAVGAKCVTTRRMGGARGGPAGGTGGATRPAISELTHIDPPKAWGVRGTDGPIRATVEVLVE